MGLSCSEVLDHCVELLRARAAFGCKGDRVGRQPEPLLPLDRAQALLRHLPTVCSLFAVTLYIPHGAHSAPDENAELEEQFLKRTGTLRAAPIIVTANKRAGGLFVPDQGLCKVAASLVCLTS
jgi:hypothetical protein